MKDEANNRTATAKVSADAMLKLRIIAQREDRTVSYIVRRFISDGIARDTRKQRKEWKGTF